MLLSTTGWHIWWVKSGHAWGSAGHGLCNCSIGATAAAASDNLGLKVPPLACKGKPANKLEQVDLNPKFYPNFSKSTFIVLLFFLVLIILSKSQLPCWSHQIFGHSALLQPPFPCNLACLKLLQTKQDNSPKKVSSCARQLQLENLAYFPLCKF